MRRGRDERLEDEINGALVEESSEERGNDLLGVLAGEEGAEGDPDGRVLVAVEGGREEKILKGGTTHLLGATALLLLDLLRVDHVERNEVRKGVEHVELGGVGGDELHRARGQIVETSEKERAQRAEDGGARFLVHTEDGGEAPHQGAALDLKG